MLVQRKSRSVERFVLVRFSGDKQEGCPDDRRQNLTCMAQLSVKELGSSEGWNLAPGNQGRISS
jgi:hypothetical protein